MNVMLIQDVANLGRVGDVVEVKNGFARNWLIPQKMAVAATKGAMKQAELLRAAAEKRRARELANAQDVANVLAGLLLRFERKVGAGARLYGSVTTAEIAEAIQERMGLELDRRRVVLDEPIKVLGNYEVAINVHPDVPASVRLQVVGENGETWEQFQAAVQAAEAEANAAPSDQPLPDY